MIYWSFRRKHNVRDRKEVIRGLASNKRWCASRNAGSRKAKRAGNIRLGTQGAMELASALFSGHGFVPYGPGQYTPSVDHHLQRQHDRGIDRYTEHQILVQGHRKYEDQSLNVSLIAIEKLIADPNNPPRDAAGQAKSELCASLRSHGVKVPLIGYNVPGGIMLGNGHRRLEAAREAGIPELPVIVFPQKPGEAELLATQLTINGHRQALNPVDEFEAFTRLSRLKDWSPSELARGLAISNAEVTRVMAIGKLSAEERQLVREGKISKSSAYALYAHVAEEARQWRARPLRVKSLVINSIARLDGRRRARR